MSQEATLAVEWRAVTVETICEGQHDVGILVHLASDLAEGDLSEGEWDDALPHLEGLSYGVERGSFTDFRGVVLNAAVESREMGI